MEVLKKSWRWLGWYIYFGCPTCKIDFEEEGAYMPE